ncbi:BED zinc finger [Striga asiatica]|uniref:BED zinc finger n=1 Tax=Striga asiatica TaxID=4170 RepID=A0A5A7NXV3_STRAF|nr:BED zinc finger [Striga asiatica]
MINLLAIVFNPWIRLDALGHHLTTYYDQLVVPVKDEHSPEPTLIENDIRQHLNNFYHEYKSKYGEKFTEPEPKTQDTGNSAKKFKCYEDFMKKVLEEKRRERKKFLEHELENYLETPFTANIEHTLQWWHASEDRFPVISRMAKEVLACPASTVAQEQVFHTEGNILSEKQSTMSPDCLEAQLCLGDWIKAGKITHTRDQAILIWWSKPGDSQ